MAMRYPGGLIATSPVNAAYPSGVWTQSQTIPYASQNVWQRDQYWRNTALLLHGDGTNGAQNNTFLDSGTANSGSGFTITRNGNTTQGSFTPFQQNGYWSNYFDGSGDYLSVTTSSLALGTGNFTIEYFIFPINFSTAQGRVSWGQGGSPNLYINTDGTVAWTNYATAVLLTSTNTVSLNAWNHVAVVRVSGTTTIYINGVSGGSVSDTNNWTAGIGTFRIMSSNGTESANAYMSNFRLVIGTAVYTAAFTPPTTPLTAITNTSLLTCQSNRFIDNSANQFTITVNGNTAVQAFQPFPGPTTWSASVLGGSGYFDGSGDYLTVPNSSSFAFGTGDFTIEFWFNTSTVLNDKIFLDFRNAGSSNNLVITTGGSSGPAGALRYASGVLDITSGSVSICNNGWNHCAAVRQSGTVRVYVNGVSTATGSDTSNFSSTSGTIQIGRNSYGGNEIEGYVSNLRIVKGTAVYTSNFTPPTAPLTNIANTSLLLNMTNAGIFDNAQMNDLETVGNAQISTSVVKYGTGSMAFDGSGDYLVGPMTPNLVFGSGNMTFECWVYANTLSDFDTIFDTRTSGGYGNEAFSVFLDGGIPKLFAGSYSGASPVIAGSSAISRATWTHIAFTRSSGTNYLFVNGASVTSNTNSWNQTLVTTNIFRIGEQVSGDVRPFDGYIDDLRITKGVARYISNFTPPIARMPNQ